MLNTIIHKRTAAIAAVFCALLTALATIWPMQLYTEDHTYTSGLDPVRISDEVTEDLDAGEYFTAQHDHLQTLEFYVNSIISGEEARVQLFHVGENSAIEILAEEVVNLPAEVPGYASVPIDADLVVGDTYVYTVRGSDGSRFTVAYESAADAEETGKAAQYQVGFYNDTSIEGVALKTRLTYTVTLSLIPSLLRAAVYVAAAALVILALVLLFALRPAWNGETTILRALQVILTPVILLAGVISFLAVWPMKLFDSRLLDILVYETGILTAVLIGLYALWHDRTGLPEGLTRQKMPDSIRHYAIIVCIALMLDASADYMNATTELVHNSSMHRIVILLSLIILFMGKAAWNGSAVTCTVALVCVVSGVIYCASAHLPATDPDYVLGNEVIYTRALACSLAAVAAASVLVMLIEAFRRKEKAPAGFSRLAAGSAVLLAVLLLLFRNTRLWIPLLIAMWAMFYLRYRRWEGRTRLLEDLCKGILLDFICKVAYSMLHRYYMAYRFSRFSMHFHTVTVTAYYLVIAAAAALVLFIMKWRETDGLPVRPRIACIWKETVLLGFAGSYMLMSLTRSGIGAAAILVVLAAFCTAGMVKKYDSPAINDSADRAVSPEQGAPSPAVQAETAEAGAAVQTDGPGAPSRNAGAFVTAGQRVKSGFAALGAIALAVICAFPMVFSGQRLISTAYGQPERFEDIETYDDWLVRNVTWNCTRFMNVEIFLRDFGDRILGGDIGSNLYYSLNWNVPQGYRTSQREDGEEEEERGLLIADSAAVLASADEAQAGAILAARGAGSGSSALRASEYAVVASMSEVATLEEDNGALQTGDLTNGRMALYLTYFENLNLTGHDVMGVTLESGEVAVHAHNVILQAAFDCGIPTGVVFLAVLVLLLALSFRYALRGWRTDRYSLLPFLLLTGFLVIGMVEWIFHFSNPFTIVVLFAIAPILFPERGEEA